MAVLRVSAPLLLVAVLCLPLLSAGGAVHEEQQVEEKLSNAALLWQLGLMGEPDSYGSPFLSRFSDVPTQPGGPGGCVSFACCKNTLNTTLWYHWYNMSCICPWHCMECYNGGEVVGEVANNRHCQCVHDYTGIDCRTCGESSCPGSSVCDTTVYVVYRKVYDCFPGKDIRALFPGRFVWQANFEQDNEDDGKVELTVYQNVDSTPLLFNCSFVGCSKSVVDDAQQFSCQDVHCLSTGWSPSTVENLIAKMGGSTTITMSPDGSGAMHNTGMPIPISYKCNASACEFPNQQGVPVSTTERILVSVAGGFTGLLVLAAIVAISILAQRKRQKYVGLAAKLYPVSLVWEHLTCELTVRPPGSRHSHKLQVLQGLSGSAAPGTVLALLGESGAGKTSLLDMLAGRKTLGQLGGTVLVNGKERGKDWKRISGYVLQDDMFMGTLTVYEHLLFTARMRLPPVVNEAERLERVDAVLAQMGLTHVKHSPIGDHSIKGISGGERKRLAIATELLGNPSILFLDEPTTGLDSANALHVVQSLSRLAHEEGKTVIFSIHQPDSLIFREFDNVHLLAKGYLVYSGPAAALALKLGEYLGAECPPNYNPADFAIHRTTEILSLEVLEELHIKNADAALIPADGRHRVVSGLLSEGGSPAGGAAGGKSIDAAMLHMNANSAEGDLGYSLDKSVMSDEESADLGEHTQSFLLQFAFLSHRSLLNIWRNPYLLRLQYGTIIILGLGLGGLYWQIGDNSAGVQNRFGLMLFLIILLSVMSLASIDTFLAERALFLRERAAGFYSTPAYFVSKTATDIIPLRMLPPALLAAILYWMVGLKPGASHFMYFLVVLVLTAFASSALCLAISSAVPRASVGNLIAILIMMFFILFSGLLLNQGNVPPAISWLRWISFIHFGFEALCVNEFLNSIFFYDGDPGTLPVPVNGRYYLGLFGMSQKYFYLDIYLLLASGIIFFVVAFIALALRKEKR